MFGCFGSIRVCRRLHIVFASGAFLRQLPLDRKLLVAPFFVSAAIVGDCQQVVRRRVCRLELYCTFQGSDSLGKSLRRHQQTAETDERVTEAGIQPCGMREMLNRSIPLFLLLSQFS